MLPVSAACVVANGLRERLSHLVGKPVTVRVFEPAIPSPAAWQAITSSALLYLVRGPAAHAALVLREPDAVALAGAAFGETVNGSRALSSIETTVLERMISVLGAACAPVCGLAAEVPAPQRVASIAGFVSYLDVQIDAPVQARIGIALSREPEGQLQGCVQIDDLLDVDLELKIRLEPTSLTAGAVAALQCGDIVPITGTRALTGIAWLAGRDVARGECGVHHDRYAIAIGRTTTSEGASEPQL